MSSPKRNHRIDYLEFEVSDLEKTKAFYGQAFDFTFTDYGPQYVAFSDGHLEGGFSTQGTPAPGGGPLVILYAEELELTQARVELAGGRVTKAIFTFPGGRRFHFLDPDGYELAVWSER